MASIRRASSITECQNFAREVYGLNNDRYFNAEDMLTQIQRFAMRGLKGIRKNNSEKIKTNLMISFSWFLSLMNQLHIELEGEVWNRFPFLCSYCGTCPCACSEKRPESRQKAVSDEKKKPKTLEEYQMMLEKIYPAKTRTLEHAGVHLAEEMGEFSEAILQYRGRHEDKDFKNVKLEAADLFSCFMGVFNSIGADVAKDFSEMFNNNCHACKKNPCECSFEKIMGYES